MTIEQKKDEGVRPTIKVVNAFIRKDDSFLIIVRNSRGYIGMMGLPGGHVEKGEEPISALKREVKEETGFQISVDDPPIFESSTVMNENDINVNVHAAQIIGGEERPQEEEIQQVLWVTPDEFIDDLRKHNYPEREVVRFSEFLSRIFTRKD